MNGYDSNTKIVRSLNWWQATPVALIVVFVTLGAVAVVLTTLSYVKEYKEKAYTLKQKPSNGGSGNSRFRNRFFTLFP